MKIAVISDTHNFFDPAIPEIFEGACHILHGGDIGQPDILKRLRAIAPVTAVRGNTDEPGFGYNLTESVELGKTIFLLHHIVNPHSPTSEMRQRILNYKPRVVVFGHTHKPFLEERDGVLFLNPGYAGKQRFSLPRTVAIIDLHKGNLRTRFHPL
jgi:putative phosphoesterase